ncbi:MAG: hypothetical protein RIF32_09010 [Leptospirales bacterium]|jgi:hypothetical protein
MYQMGAFYRNKGLQTRRIPGWLLYFVSGLLGLQCSQTDNVIRAWDAQIRINASYFAKIEQCGQPAGLLLLVPHDVQEPDVALCEGEILAAACPVVRIPPSCILLYFKPAPRSDVDKKPKL